MDQTRHGWSHGSLMSREADPYGTGSPRESRKVHLGAFTEY
jgi:hypothetical protein